MTLFDQFYHVHNDYVLISVIIQLILLGDNLTEITGYILKMNLSIHTQTHTQIIHKLLFIVHYRMRSCLMLLKLVTLLELIKQ